MATNILIAITCLVILVVVGVTLPYIQQEFTGESTDFGAEGTLSGTADGIEEIGQSIDDDISLFDIIGSLLGVLTWSFDLNIFINVLLWIIKIAMVLAFADMAWVG